MATINKYRGVFTGNVSVTSGEITIRTGNSYEPVTSYGYSGVSWSSWPNKVHPSYRDKLPDPNRYDVPSHYAVAETIPGADWMDSVRYIYFNKIPMIYEYNGVKYMCHDWEQEGYNPSVEMDEKLLLGEETEFY